MGEGDRLLWRNLFMRERRASVLLVGCAYYQCPPEFLPSLPTEDLLPGGPAMPYLTRTSTFCLLFHPSPLLTGWALYSFLLHPPLLHAASRVFLHNDIVRAHARFTAAGALIISALTRASLSAWGRRHQHALRRTALEPKLVLAPRCSSSMALAPCDTVHGTARM